MCSWSTRWMNNAVLYISVLQFSLFSFTREGGECDRFCDCTVVRMSTTCYGPWCSCSRTPHCKWCSCSRIPHCKCEQVALHDGTPLRYNNTQTASSKDLYQTYSIRFSQSKVNATVARELVHDHSICTGKGEEKATPKTSNFMFIVIILHFRLLFVMTLLQHKLMNHINTELLWPTRTNADCMQPQLRVYHLSHCT